MTDRTIFNKKDLEEFQRKDIERIKEIESNLQFLEQKDTSNPLTSTVHGERHCIVCYVDHFEKEDTGHFNGLVYRCFGCGRTYDKEAYLNLPKVVVKE